MIEFLSILLQLGFVLFAGYVVYLTSMMADADRRDRRAGMRAGTHDYYGNKIDDSNNKKV